MRNDETDSQKEWNAVLQEKARVEKDLKQYQHHLLEKDKWLQAHTPTTQGYQEALEEWLALQGYVTELYAQVASLDERLQDMLAENQSL